jgi:holo-[acyl-carrier protein] synthase
MIRNFEYLDNSLCGALIREWNIGVDIVEITRFERLDYSSNKQFYKRVFTPREIDYCLSFNSPEPHFAANFAGKEAVYKAVNMFCDVNLNSIEILRNENGSPVVNLHLSSEENVETLQVKVSLSHSLSHAIAFAVVYRSAKLANGKGKAEARSTHVL